VRTRRRFGKIVQYEELPFRAIGVAQAGFRGVDAGIATDAWVPVTAVDTGLTEAGSSWLDVLARVRPGVNPAQAQAALVARFQRHVAEELLPGSTGRYLESLKAQHVRLRPAASGFAHDGREYEMPLLVLLAVVGVVLLISCANVANLLLARNLARRQEISVRLALGAGRGRIAAQLLTESLMVALAGAMLGLGLGVWGSRLLLKLLPPARVPLAFDLHPDMVVLGWTALIAVATAVLCGIGPAWRAGRSGNGFNLDGGRVTRRSFAGKALVAGQLALSLVLITGAGLFLKTLHRLATTDLGFRPERVVAFELSFSRAVSQEHRAQVSGEILARLGERDGFSATYTWPGVYENGAWTNGVKLVDGNAPPPAADNDAQAIAVGPEFFETLGIGLLAGRTINLHDDAAAPVVVVNESFARKYFSGVLPVGHHITMGARKPVEREIVGVVRDVKHMGVKAKVLPGIYFPAL
jgi:putative ABC transport system permease protein